MTAHPPTLRVLGPRAAFTRAEGDLLDIQAQMATVEALLARFAAQRTALSHDPRLAHNGDVLRLALADARHINEILNRIRGMRDRIGAARDALEADYRQGVSRTEEGA